MRIFWILILTLTMALPGVARAGARWSIDESMAWSRAQPWLVGTNFLPSTASNQLEMWQSSTFDPETIDRELGWAAGVGFNVARIFLHDLAYREDPKGFLSRVDRILGIAAKHGIRVLFVIFDSCWDPAPRVGPQAEPRPGVHNSRWVQSPGLEALSLAQNPESETFQRLHAYVREVVTRFAQDPRVLGWDVWNEANNLNGGSYNDPVEKLEEVRALLPKAIQWVREALPSQPLTVDVWDGDWRPPALGPIQKIALESSDIVSFHNYGNPEDFQKRVDELKVYGRPLLCTEYMARPLGSTFKDLLPIADRQNIGMINWGLVQGRSQTYIPWDSWSRAYAEPVKSWFHDIFRTDGQAYLPEETEFLRSFVRDRPWSR